MYIQVTKQLAAVALGAAAGAFGAKVGETLAAALLHRFFGEEPELDVDKLADHVAERVAKKLEPPQQE